MHLTRLRLAETPVNRVAKQRPFLWTPWDLILEKCCTVVNGQRQIIFSYRLNCALILKYDVCHFKRSFYKSIKSHFVVKMVKYHLVFVKLLRIQQLLSSTIYFTNTNMAVMLAQFLWFLQKEGRWIKTDQNHSKHGHVESCS